MDLNGSHENTDTAHLGCFASLRRALRGEAIVNVTVFLSTFGVVFLAELGDKTQLAAMALSTKYPWRKIFIGLAGAFALLNLGAVLVGKLLFTLLPVFWIKLASGALFLFFGIATLLARQDDQDEQGEEGKRARSRGPMLTAFIMILLAELGDKTQIVTASLSAQYDSPSAVFLGSTLALWTVSLMGIFLGMQLHRFIPRGYINKGAGCLFLAFGAVILWQAFAAVA
jgi:Ca2+/H+ antiporter, TMEM165/GDT1 family